MLRILLPTLAALAVTTAILLAPPGEPLPTRSLRALWEFSHIAGFAALTLFLLWLAGQRCPNKALPPKTASLILSIVALLGILTEFYQPLFGRSFSPADLLRNLVGMITGCCLWLVFTRKSRPALLTALTALVLAIPATSGPISGWIDEHQAKQDFPVLVDFNHSRQLSRFELPDQALFEIIKTVQGRNAGRYPVAARGWSGFSLEWFPRDWRNFDSLQVELHNRGSETLPMMCRVEDHRHDGRYEDRFSHEFGLPPGSLALNLSLDDIAAAPQGRSMDMAKLSRLGCFAKSPGFSGDFDLLGITLLKNP